MKVMNNKEDSCFKILCLALSACMVLVLSGASTAEAADVAEVQSDAYLYY